jgi:hypothetical protein
MTTAANETNSKPNLRRPKPATHYLKPKTCLCPARILIADLPIRNRPNPCALNTNCISNRQKKGIFSKPVTHNLKPAAYLSNRNCKELKTDVTA